MKHRDRQSPMLLPSSPSTSAMEDETIVSQILLDLKTLMSLSESLSRFNWTCRKRRSSLDTPPPPPPPPGKKTPAAVAVAAAVRTTASPDTPLTFSPGDCDGKCNKSSKKRTRDEYRCTIHELNQKRNLLRGEIETVKNYYQKLKDFNSELKGVKQRVLNSCARKDEEEEEDTQMEMERRMNIPRHHPPLMGDPTAEIFRAPFGSISSNGLESVNQLSRLNWIDLNMPPEEIDVSQPLDVVADRRARFAEARRKRKGIIKVKAMRNACGLKLPFNR
ncbi:uncharacterized protein LOC127264296 isoform X2 [Andrographis paniculata]|uniref:uncharacterized protein LOC127264296 isoform X2 n=1 Tax=Andrographis paniculata TaxID=175694 RepID=UPI0021E77837|nr:uncharacterized protein LOC127264296 isoform X2 [Andrographis paniculata]